MKYFLLIFFIVFTSCAAAKLQIKTWRIGESAKLERTENSIPVFQEILPDSLNYRCYSAQDDEKWRKALKECSGGQ